MSRSTYEVHVITRPKAILKRVAGRPKKLVLHVPPQIEGLGHARRCQILGRGPPPPPRPAPTQGRCSLGVRVLQEGFSSSSSSSSEETLEEPRGEEPEHPVRTANMPFSVRPSTSKIHVFCVLSLQIRPVPSTLDKGRRRGGDSTEHSKEGAFGGATGRDCFCFVRIAQVCSARVAVLLVLLFCSSGSRHMLPGAARLVQTKDAPVTRGNVVSRTR
jgi:hypothetical protein